jgi:hypothetical protein
MDLDRQWFKSNLFNVNKTPNFHRNKWVALNYTHFWRKWACFDCRIMGKLNETYINRFDMANKKYVIIVIKKWYVLVLNLKHRQKEM